MPDFLAELQNLDASAEDLADYERREAPRKARIDAAPITTMASAYRTQSYRWLTEHQERFRGAGDPILTEALEVILHDSAFVGARLHRALDGRDRHRHGEDDEDDPVQNDWNGSAKVALIPARDVVRPARFRRALALIRRSARFWPPRPQHRETR